MSQSQQPRFVLFTAALALAAIVAGCTSSQDKNARGLFAVKVGASRPIVEAPISGAGSNDPMSRVAAAKTTISAIEARRSDGTWAPVDGGFPTVIDLLALAKAGTTATLPSGLLPDGHYTALQIHVVKGDLTQVDGTHAVIKPAGAGWSVIVPVDFEVITDRAMLVELNVRLDRSFKLVSDSLDFEPDFEVTRIEHD
jgi:hypothetical protein